MQGVGFGHNAGVARFSGARPSTGLRALLATVEIMTGVLLAHSAAGGALPSATWLLVLAGIVFASSLLVLRRRVRLRWMIPLLVIAQLALHDALAAAHPAAHGVHGAVLATQGPSTSWQMLAAHLVSAAITALVWSVRRRLQAVLRGSSRALTTIRPVPRPTVRAEAPAQSVWLGIWALGSPWRGPPQRVPAA